ncbi:MAG: nicotinate (nicotinamide) nucleotide adenylyltransferase [Odoribacter sp.]
MTSIGLFFGSFNPIHNGHLKIAQYLLYKGYCNRVWFVVSPRNPLKRDSTLLEETKRLEIVKAAIAGDVRIEACDIEFTMPRPSYTLDTLRLLEKKYPNTTFALIIGEDNLRDFHLWRDASVIADNYRILVYPRKGMKTSNLMWKNLFLVDAPMADISSTEIRQKIRNNEDISAMVPANAHHLILDCYNINES